jgi:nucleotide-binding universal stress UspA family protein
VKLERILLPTDFSETSAHALEQAGTLAGWYGSTVVALHVHSPLLQSAATLGSTAPYGLGVPAYDEAAELQRLDGQTRSFLEPISRAGVPVEVVVDVGRPAHQILERATTLPADLIVIGTHGLSGFQHLVLGSVAEKVLRRAPCPVLTVPPKTHATSALPFREIVCPVDFSDSSLAAVTVALSIAGESRASLTLLHSVEWPWDEPPAPNLDELPAHERHDLAEFRRYLETQAKARLSSLVPVQSQGASNLRHLVRHGKPHRQVLAVAAEQQADLIVIGVHGRNALDMAFFGSTTNQVVRHATCPVLTVRSRR